MIFKDENIFAKPERKFKGVWISAKIWDNPDLTWLQKCLLAEIDCLSTESEPCMASNAYLGSKFGVVPGRMANMISELRTMGYLETIEFDGRVRKLKVKTPLFTESVMRVNGTREGGVTEPVKSPITIEKRIEKRENKEASAVADPPPFGGRMGLVVKGKSIPVPAKIPHNLDTQEFHDVWVNYRAQRKKDGCNMSVASQEANLQDLAKLPVKVAIETVRQSLKHGWKGIFPLKTERVSVPGGNGKPSTTWELKQKLEATDARIKEVRGRGTDFPMGWQAASEEDAAELRTLKARRKELLTQLSS